MNIWKYGIIKETNLILTLNNNPSTPCLRQHFIICLCVFLRNDLLLVEVEVGAVAVDATLKGKNRRSDTPSERLFLFPSFFNSMVLKTVVMNGLHVAAHDAKEGREGSVTNIPGPACSTGNTAKPKSVIDRSLFTVCDEDGADAYGWLWEAVASIWYRPTVPFGNMMAAIATAEELSSIYEETVRLQYI